MPSGVLDPTFLTAVSRLIAHADNVAQANTNAELRAWFLGDETAWSGDPLDVAAISDAFSRESVGSNYASALSSTTGSLGDAMSAKLQSDKLAAMERAFRMRHASPIRSTLHAASRRMGHGNAADGVVARMATMAQDLIVAGAAGFTS